MPKSAPFRSVHPCNLAGAYVNFMMDDEAAGRVQATYGDNYARLALVKAKYDPRNLFRVNQNIEPTPPIDDALIDAHHGGVDFVPVHSLGELKSRLAMPGA